MFGFFKKKLKEVAEKAKNIFSKNEEREEEREELDVPESLKEFESPEIEMDISEVSDREKPGDSELKQLKHEERAETDEGMDKTSSAAETSISAGEEEGGEKVEKEKEVKNEAHTDAIGEPGHDENEIARRLVEENIEDAIEHSPELLEPPMEKEEEIPEQKKPGKLTPEIAEKAVEELEKTPIDSEISKKETEMEAETEIEAIEKEAEQSGNLEKISKLEEEILEKEKPEKREGFFKSILKGLTKKIIKEEHLEDIIFDLKLSLIEADVALDVAEKICEDVKRELVGTEVGKGEDVEKLFISALKKSMLSMLDIPHESLVEEIRRAEKPYLILFIGFNGVGKTTTLAKMAKYLMDNGFSVVLAAGDTFRAASIEQLEEHGGKLGVRVIKKDYGHDAAAVIYDAVQYAKKNGIDVVLADTAGRSHENQNLMDELKKIIRVTNPNKKILVIDSITGNDAVIQAESFADAGIDGIIMTKMDVNEKGGSALSVVYSTKKPILFITTGQEYGDFEEFSAEKMVERLFEGVE